MTTMSIRRSINPLAIANEDKYLNHFRIQTVDRSPVPSRVGFIAMQRDKIGESLGAKPVAFALIQVIGERYEKFNLIELAEFTCDRESIVKGVFHAAEQKPFSVVWIDETTTEPNYTWLNGDRFYTRAADRARIYNFDANRPDYKYPSIRPTVDRGRDLAIRQMTAIVGRIERDEIVFNKHIASNAGLKARAIDFGNSPAADALAGALERATQLQRFFRSELNRKSANKSKR